MSNLYDTKLNSIPVCNAILEDNRKLHVPDAKVFTEKLETVKNAKMFGAVAIFVLILLLCIFSLNFNSSGWSGGNILTFVVIITIILTVFNFGKGWYNTFLDLKDMETLGSPCMITEEGKNILHCSEC